MSDAHSPRLAAASHAAPAHILLVDNDASTAQAAKSLLEQLGYRVTTCTQSAEALVLIHTASEQFSCVVSDLSMRAIGGLELASTCRLCRPGTPFLLTSDNPGALSTDFLQSVGISGFITKPFSAERLAETVRDALARRGI